jgi:transcriptional regulator with XRE-family HTH domain
MKGYPKFKALLVERGIRQKEVAAMLGITLSNFNNKLNGIGDFTITDVKKICKELGIKADLFFVDSVPKKEQS